MNRKWQDDFVRELENMTNQEIFDLYITMVNGVYWAEEKLDPRFKDSIWMSKETEDELNYRLKDWFDGEDLNEDLDEDYDDDEEDEESSWDDEFDDEEDSDVDPLYTDEYVPRSR